MARICNSRSKFLVLFIISLTLFPGLSCSSEDHTTDVEIAEEKIAALTVKDIQYGKHPAQTYDLYLPADRSPSETKVLVFLHGGGWVGGDKKDMDAYIPLLRIEHPYHAIINMNYRLAKIPDMAAFPNQFFDIQMVLEQVASKAKDLKIQPIFGIIGVSAGGHLALQYDAIYDLEDRVKMVCSIVGPTDLTDPFYKSNPYFKMAIKYLVDEDSFAGITNYGRAVSPLYHVSDKTSPTILFYGENDPLVPVRSGIAFKKELDAFGVSNSLTIFDGGHGDWQKVENDIMQLKLSSFIDTYLPVH